MTNGKNNSGATWINDGEKYALVGLSVNLEGQIPSGNITPSLWILADTRFDIPIQWQEWLGSIRAQEVKGANLFLLSKLPSSTPAIFDDENKKLQQSVWNFYTGLLLASTFAGHAYRLPSGQRN